MRNGGLEEAQVGIKIARRNINNHRYTDEEGVPDLPVAPQDEAGLTKTFQTWPRGGFHIP